MSKSETPWRTLLRAFGVNADGAQLSTERDDFRDIQLRVGVAAPEDIWGGLRRASFLAEAQPAANLAEYATLKLTGGGEGAILVAAASASGSTGALRIGVGPVVALTAEVAITPVSFEVTPNRCTVATGTLAPATADVAGFVAMLHAAPTLVGIPGARDVSPYAIYVAPGRAAYVVAGAVNVNALQSLAWLELRGPREPVIR